MLKSCFTEGLLEAGCDEAGRGCLAGPVFAAAVILDPQKPIVELDDSKKLSPLKRLALRERIEKEALAFAVAQVDPGEIDEINILNASFLAMHRAIKQLNIVPDLLLVDGNRFRKYMEIPYQCIIKGDGIYSSIAAASILAKTYRDDYMLKLSSRFPAYGWDTNKGYPTLKHRDAIKRHGITPHHRKSFRLTDEQLTIVF